MESPFWMAREEAELRLRVASALRSGHVRTALETEVLMEWGWWYGYWAVGCYPLVIVI